VYFPQLAWTVAAAAARSRLQLLDESVLTLRVWPDDLDFNLHMNNARYLTAMEMGRWDLAIRQGWMPKVWSQRWQILIGSATVRFKRALKPFERYALHTRIAGWNDKWFFIEHALKRKNGDVAASGAVKGIFRGKDGNVPTPDVMRTLGFEGAGSPPTPEWIAQWHATEPR
jgi:acyl-CoA thioesterase FadM